MKTKILVDFQICISVPLTFKPSNLMIWLFNYWRDLALGSAGTYFLEVGAYLSLNRATAAFWEGRFCWILQRNYIDFLNITTEYHEFLCLITEIRLRSVETYFHEVGSYVCLKRAAAGVWEGRFCWIWVKISQFFKHKNRGVEPKNFIV